MVHIAMHDAIQAFQYRYESYTDPISGASGSPVAAAATAARDVLVNRFPAQAASIDTTYQNYLSPKGLTTDPGIAVGQRAAAQIISARANDGNSPLNPETFIGGTGPGEWRPTPPLEAPMSAPWFGDVVPFALNDSAGLLPEPPPPHLRSGAYAKAYEEVKTLGARFNSSRTCEQTELAYFYAGNFFNQMNRAVGQIVVHHVPDIGDSARLFAVANIAAADALMSAWKNKRYYFFWRPSTAIHEGDSDGNPKTAGDEAWQPLINDPNYPDYTSGANSITGAFMRTLALFFGDHGVTFDLTTAVVRPSDACPPQQTRRTYFRFSDVAADVVEARILLGIHFRFADVVARRQGKQAADWVFAHILRPLH